MFFLLRKKKNSVPLISLFRIIILISAEQKAKLKWQCRRGMLELDLILNRFLKENVDHMDIQQINSFETLLTHSDPEINLWLMGYEEPQEKELIDIVALIRLQRKI